MESPAMTKAAAAANGIRPSGNHAFSYDIYDIYDMC